jgi:glycosyltransferase involved in cell wall biosynthesis
MNKPIRVLCVTPSGVDGRGGIDRLYLYLRELTAQKPISGVAMQYFAARGHAPGLLWMVTFPWRVILFTIRLMAWTPDVVHFNFASGGSVLRKYVLLRIAKLFGAKTFVHFHGQFTADDVAARSPDIHHLVPICRHASRVVVLGKTYRRAFIELIGVPAHKIIILPNGIPDFAAALPLPKPRRTATTMVFLGEIGLRKGADILIQALALLAQRTRAWTCTVAGDGDVARYRSAAEECGIAGTVRFTGWIDAPEVHRLSREADIVVLPSRSEALPLTLLEGACAGAALVATAVGEIPDIVHDGVNGLLVGIDADELATALERLITERDTLASMQMASRQIYSEKFSLDAFATALRAIYLELAEEATTAREPVIEPRSALRRKQG